MAEACVVPAGWPGRKQVARTRVEDASLRLFAEQGFERTTVDDLATASGVGRRTIFRYFPSKNDIVFGALDDRLDVLTRELATAGAAGLPLVDMMRRAFHVAGGYAPAERASLAVRIQLIATVPSLRAHAALRYLAWEDTVRAAVAARTGQRGVYTRACAKAIIAVMWAAFETWRENGAGDDLAEMIDAALDVLASGLAGAPTAAPAAGAAAPAAPAATPAAPAATPAAPAAAPAAPAARAEAAVACGAPAAPAGASEPAAPARSAGNSTEPEGDA
jgi:TetR/AcrR family transcriptional regulator, regulator of mycofactocin system